jgi:hypothetical protein
MGITSRRRGNKYGLFADGVRAAAGAAELSRGPASAEALGPALGAGKAAATVTAAALRTAVRRGLVRQDTDALVYKCGIVIINLG